MLYEFPLKIPADTAKADAETLTAELCVGVVKGVSVQFPAGCSGMVYISIWRGGHPVWPTNIDEGIAGEDVVISWPESYELNEQEYGFELRGWSPNTRYDHTVTIRFAIGPLPELIPETPDGDGVLSLADILG